MDSILTTIKHLLGIDEEYEYFDTDITVGINSAISSLTQMGIGPEEGFLITGKNDTWSSFIGADNPKLEMVKTYIYIKTKLVFDPPLSSSVIEALNRSLDEYTWRLSIEHE